MIPVTKEQFAAFFDHTLLNPMAVRADIERHCGQAQSYGFYSVCVLPRWVSLAADMLHSGSVKVGSVAGFPFGADTTKSKIAAAKEVIFAGADEVDMVADLAAIIEGDRKYLSTELREVLNVCRSMRPAVCLKVIIESAALNDEQKTFACAVAQEVGVDFIKTSTSLNAAGGATVEDVRFLVQAAPRCKIKAAGGIRNAEQAMAMIRAGASRIGASASVEITEQFAKGILQS